MRRRATLILYAWLVVLPITLVGGCRGTGPALESPGMPGSAAVEMATPPARTLSPTATTPVVTPFSPAPSERATGVPTTPTVTMWPHRPDAHDDSFSPALSADGRFVVFTSRAGDLVETPLAVCPGMDGSSLNCASVFVRDRQTGTATLVSVSNEGQPGNADSFHLDISADGRWIAFSSGANNLDEAKRGWELGVFLHDREARTVQLLSPSGNEPAISADGRFVAFSGLTDGWNVYVFDRTTGQSELLSASTDGQPGDGDSLSPDISADGRWVAFWSWAGNLTADDVEHCQPQGRNYSCGDVFLFDRQTGERIRLPVGVGYGLGMGTFSLSLSGDGSRLTFNDVVYDRASGQLGPLCSEAINCSGGVLSEDGLSVIYADSPNIYVFDRLTGERDLVSVTSDGVAGNGTVVNYSFTSEGEQLQPGVALSADGRWAAFSSTADNLADGDAAQCSNFLFAAHNCYDIFVHDRSSGATEWISRPIDIEQ